MKIGNQIESESFDIIRSELGETTFTEEELSIVIRVIHATGDFEYASNLHISQNAIQDAVTALASSCQIFTDVNMVRSGISKRFLKDTGRVICRIDDPQTRIFAEEYGITRSAAEMRMDKEKLNGAIIAIGNAPTALLEVIRLIAEEQIQPALVVGVPVGFVNAAESKEALWKMPISCITSLGRKGGSPVAAAITNALTRIAYAA